MTTVLSPRAVVRRDARGHRRAAVVRRPSCDRNSVRQRKADKTPCKRSEKQGKQPWLHADRSRSVSSTSPGCSTGIAPGHRGRCSTARKGTVLAKNDTSETKSERQCLTCSSSTPGRRRYRTACRLHTRGRRAVPAAPGTCNRSRSRQFPRKSLPPRPRHARQAPRRCRCHPPGNRCPAILCRQQDRDERRWKDSGTDSERAVKDEPAAAPPRWARPVFPCAVTAPPRNPPTYPDPPPPGLSFPDDPPPP